MSTKQEYIDAGLPRKILGRGWKTWTRSNIGRILEHHGVKFNSSTSKLELLRQLHEVCEELDLRREDFLWNKVIPLDTATRRYLPAIKHGRRTIYRPGGRKMLQPANTRLGSMAHAQQITAAADSKYTIKREYVKNEFGSDAENALEFDQRPMKTLVKTEKKLPKIECSICLQGLSIKRFPKHPITSSCNHSADVCVECLRQSIASQFATNVWDQIDCPTCEQRLGYMDMKIHANPDDFRRY